MGNKTIFFTVLATLTFGCIASLPIYANADTRLPRANANLNVPIVSRYPNTRYGCSSAFAIPEGNTFSQVFWKNSRFYVRQITEMAREFSTSPDQNYFAFIGSSNVNTSPISSHRIRVGTNRNFSFEKYTAGGHLVNPVLGVPTRILTLAEMPTDVGFHSFDRYFARPVLSSEASPIFSNYEIHALLGEKLGFVYISPVSVGELAGNRLGSIMICKSINPDDDSSGRRFVDADLKDQTWRGILEAFDSYAGAYDHESSPSHPSIRGARSILQPPADSAAQAFMPSESVTSIEKFRIR